MKSLDRIQVEKIEAELLAGDSVSEIATRHSLPQHKVYTIRTRLKKAGQWADNRGSADIEPEEPEEPLLFGGEPCHTLTLEVPVSRMDWILGNVSLDDAIAVLLGLDEDTKRWAIELVIQRRLQKLVESPANEETFNPEAIWRTTPAGAA